MFDPARSRTAWICSAKVVIGDDLEHGVHARVAQHPDNCGGRDARVDNGVRLAEHADEALDRRRRRDWKNPTGVETVLPAVNPLAASFAATTPFSAPARAAAVIEPKFADAAR